MTRIQVYEMAWKEAQVDSTGPSMTFLDALYRYWEPVILADPMFCGVSVERGISVSSDGITTASENVAEAAKAASKENDNVLPNVAGSLPTLKAKLVSEKDFDEDDIVFLAEVQSKAKYAGKKRRKDTHYLGGIIKY